MLRLGMRLTKVDAASAQTWVTKAIAGGVITVAAACFFCVSNFRFHMLQVLVLSLLISLVLFAIADIDRPYQGVVIVAPNGFESVAQKMQVNRTR